jgi:hypothetical protein
MKGEIRMANALKCDRCGNYFDYEPNVKNFIAFGHKDIIVGKNKPVKDICPSCMEQFMKWFEKPDIDDTDFTDRSNGATEKELELASKLNDAKNYIAQLKSELGYTITKEEIEFMKGIHNFTDEDVSEAAKFVETKSSSEEYKDPCMSCHDCHCKQCYYGYISEEDKKKRWLENHKKETKLSDPYEDGGL